MSTTTAYYTTPTAKIDAPDFRRVTLTTDHPLSSYGQPVVIEGDKVSAAIGYPRMLHRYRDSDVTMVDAVNRLSGHPSEFAAHDAEISGLGLFGAQP